MNAFLGKHRAVITGFLVLTLPLILMFLHGRRHTGTTVFEKALVAVTSPVQVVADAVAGTCKAALDNYLFLVGVKAENATLRRKLEALYGLEKRTSETERENHRLKSLCEFRRDSVGLVTVAAHVVGRDISPFFRVVRVVVDAGSAEGVSEGMAVVTERGVVGRVSRLSGRFAEVMLTTDSRSQVSVRIAGRGVVGTLVGKGSSSEYEASFMYLHKNEPIQPDDVVLTTGHDRIFPPGITVGYVMPLAEEKQEGVHYVVDVVPAVNFSVLEEVLIVKATTGDLPPQEGVQ